MFSFVLTDVANSCSAKANTRLSSFRGANTALPARETFVFMPHLNRTLLSYRRYDKLANLKKCALCLVTSCSPEYYLIFLSLCHALSSIGAAEVLASLSRRILAPVCAKQPALILVYHLPCLIIRCP